MTLTDRIITCQDLPEKLIHVPQWKVDVLVRGLTVGQMREARMASKKNGELVEELLFVHYVIHGTYHPETKQKLFEPAHRDALLNKNVAAVAMIANEVAKLSQLGIDALEEAEKNSPKTPNSDSSSNSPGSSGSPLVN